MKYILLLGLFYSAIYQSQAQSFHNLLMWGDDHYINEDYEKAQLVYSDAVSKDESSIKANYNLGNALYKQSRYPEAVKHYENAANNTEDTYLKSKANYNLGNAHLQQAEDLKKQIQEAIEKEQANLNNVKLTQMGKQMYEAYKNAKTSYVDALKNNPQDYDAKNNLAYTQRILRQIHNLQKQQQQQQQDKQDKQDQKQDQKQQQQEDQKQEDKPINQNPQPQNRNPQDIKKDEMQRMMQIIENEDKKAQEKLLKRIHSNKPAPKKAW
ncbi:MAG: tetratricopeptide repeat protein [Saprospiraceae bacterium]|nr:tetratricopeptide repeat protein [Saprospiraceae bacterium]